MALRSKRGYTRRKRRTRIKLRTRRKRRTRRTKRISTRRKRRTRRNMKGGAAGIAAKAVTGRAAVKSGAKLGSKRVITGAAETLGMAFAVGGTIKAKKEEKKLKEEHDAELLGKEEEHASALQLKEEEHASALQLKEEVLKEEHANALQLKEEVLKEEHDAELQLKEEGHDAALLEKDDELKSLYMDNNELIEINDMNEYLGVEFAEKERRLIQEHEKAMEEQAQANEIALMKQNRRDYDRRATKKGKPPPSKKKMLNQAAVKRKENKKKAEEIFLLVDKNKDDSIDRDEFDQFMEIRVFSEFEDEKKEQIVDLFEDLNPQIYGEDPMDHKTFIGYITHETLSLNLDDILLCLRNKP